MASLRAALAVFALVAFVGGGAVADEARLVELPSGGRLALSTRGSSAFRVRLAEGAEFETPMVAPDEEDAPFAASEDDKGKGISAAIGSILVSPTGKLLLQDRDGVLVMSSDPIAAGARTLTLSQRTGEVFGHGSSPFDAKDLTSWSSKPIVCNKATYAPHYYSRDGYAALGAVNATSGGWNSNSLPATFQLAAGGLTWTFGTQGPWEIYLMPARSLAEGTGAYYGLIGAPAVPPRYAFGFMASRWGWKGKQDVVDTMTKFREGRFPIDAVICDFEWFTKENDYAFAPSRGEPWYTDFGFNDAFWGGGGDTLKKALSGLRRDQQVRYGGIRKPRLGNQALIDMAQSKNWISPVPEPGGQYPPQYDQSYGKGRVLNFSQAAVRRWYADEMAHFVDDGVDFWWNDEGENDYFTFHWWNVAQADALRSKDPDRRFFSLNRAWSPGMARLGAAVWTGDLNAAWDELERQPGMVLNWALGGAPYVACDIGGFAGQTTPELLTRWMQMGAFMPLMRVHSDFVSTPHFPWLFGEKAAVAIRHALETRYKLLPYHYSLAHAMSYRRKQWIRPLAMDYPEDSRAAGIATQWMDGDILLAPVLKAGNERLAYLPNGTWHVFKALEPNVSITVRGPLELKGKADFDEVPAFVRAGSIVVMAPVLQHSGELPGGSLEVCVYGGADAEFELVEDDGETMAYTRGEVLRTTFRWDDQAGVLSWTRAGAAAPATAFRHFWPRLVEEKGIYSLPPRDLAAGSVGLRSQMSLVPGSTRSAKELSEAATVLLT